MKWTLYERQRQGRPSRSRRKVLTERRKRGEWKQIDRKIDNGEDSGLEDTEVRCGLLGRDEN